MLQGEGLKIYTFVRRNGGVRSAVKKKESFMSGGEGRINLNSLMYDKVENNVFSTL